MSAEQIRLDAFSLNCVTRRAWVHGRPVQLSEKELDLAACFLGSPGRILDRVELHAKVWHRPWVETSRTLDTHVSRLRRKLELDGQHGWRLCASYQRGYALRPCATTP